MCITHCVTHLEALLSQRNNGIVIYRLVFGQFPFIYVDIQTLRHKEGKSVRKLRMCLSLVTVDGEDAEST